MAKKFDFTADKLLQVGIENVQTNGYNPKKLDTKEYKNVVKSIEIHGFTSPIIVRNNPDVTSDVQYVIIDGQNRYLAAKELGYKTIPVYNEGDVSDEDAKSLTIWHQVQVPFDEIDLSQLVVELDNLKVELPYTESEITDFRNMAEFDFDYEREEPDEVEGDDGLVPYSIRLTSAQLEIFKRAIDIIKEDNDCSDGRACELLAADYLAGYAGEITDDE